MLEQKSRSLVKNLNPEFNVKDMTILEHKHDIVYFGSCPKHNCKNSISLKLVEETLRELQIIIEGIINFLNMPLLMTIAMPFTIIRTLLVKASEKIRLKRDLLKPH